MVNVINLSTKPVADAQAPNAIPVRVISVLARFIVVYRKPHLATEFHEQSQHLEIKSRAVANMRRSIKPAWAALGATTVGASTFSDRCRCEPANMNCMIPACAAGVSIAGVGWYLYSREPSAAGVIFDRLMHFSASLPLSSSICTAVSLSYSAGKQRHRIA